jgi:hypothetical protein
MRLMTLIALALLPAAWPAGAQDRLRPATELPALAQTAPGLDQDNCIALAAKMDASEAGKRKATAKEKTGFDECVVRFNCSKVRASDAPLSAYTTSESWMRYMIQMCGSQK